MGLQRCDMDLRQQSGTFTFARLPLVIFCLISDFLLYEETVLIRRVHSQWKTLCQEARPQKPVLTNIQISSLVCVGSDFRHIYKMFAVHNHLLVCSNHTVHVFERDLSNVVSHGIDGYGFVQVVQLSCMEDQIVIKTPFKLLSFDIKARTIRTYESKELDLEVVALDNHYWLREGERRVKLESTRLQFHQFTFSNRFICGLAQLHDDLAVVFWDRKDLKVAAVKRIQNEGFYTLQHLFGFNDEVFVYFDQKEQKVLAYPLLLAKANSPPLFAFSIPLRPSFLRVGDDTLYVADRQRVYKCQMIKQ